MTEFTDQLSGHGRGPWSIQADWIIPVAGPAIRDGILVVEQDRIRSIGHAGQVKPSANHERLAPGLAILPGLVNAHTHLELSGLRGQLPRNVPMPEWILALLRYRPDRAGQLAGVRAGVQECLATGTTTVGDISYNNAACHELAKLPIRAVAFAEVLGIAPADHDAMARLARQLDNPPQGPLLTHGISPHAPYSTSPSVYRDAIALARRRGWPIMTHLAETPGEGDLLRNGGGPLLDLLRRLGVIDTSFPKLGLGPVELARQLGLLEADCLLAHVNYTDDAELDILATGRASVVYCPLSSRFFGRGGHRFADMLRRGINVAIGTDSLASNDSLDMLAELRAIWSGDAWAGATPAVCAGVPETPTAADAAAVAPNVGAPQILEMGTINGAKALGLADRTGSLEPGKQADLIIVNVGQTDDPVAAVLQGQGGVERTIVAGRAVFRKSR